MIETNASGAQPRQSSWLGWLKWLGIALVALLTLLVVAGLVLDTTPGRRFLADRIERVAPESGLRFEVGGIDGSIYRQARLTDVRVYDPQGLFLRVERAELDWRPLEFLWRNRLTINNLVIPRAELRRLPRLNETDDDRPILPDFDILIRRLQVDRLAVAEPVAGRAALVRLAGRADIHAGTADVDLDLAGIDTGDRARLTLVAAPDRRVFDLDADIVGPQGGLIAGVIGLDRPLSGVVRGSGNWERWTGALLLDGGDDSLARLRLTANAGRYTVRGRIDPARLTGGIVARLTAGGAAVDIDGTFADRRFDGRAQMVSDAITLDATGRLDLGSNRLGNVRAEGWLRQPSALLRTMRGEAIRFDLLADGPMAGLRYEYRLSAPWLAFGRTRLDGIEARGAGVAGRARTTIPVRLRVARVSGIGALAERIVRNLTADGSLVWQGDSLAANDLRVRADGLNGRVDVVANLRRGSYAADFDGALPGLEIGGLGRVDLVTDLEIRPTQRGFAIAGNVRAAMRRLDNGFLRGLTGGLPQLSTSLRFGPDGIVRFSNLRVTSPLLNATGAGIRRRDGTFQLAGSGVHRTYGPVRFTLDGPIERPLVNLTLDRPLNSAGLAGVTLRLVPTARGFDFTSAGQSLLGPFTARGAIIIGGAGQTFIDLANLSVGGTNAAGRIRILDGGLGGELRVSGGGLDGTIDLSVPGGVQRIAANLRARDVRFAGPPPILIRRGRVELVALLDPRGTDLRAQFSGSGIRRGDLSIARIIGDAALVNGRGTVRASIAGARGRDFALQMAAAVAPERIRLRAAGRFNGRAIALTRDAIFTREDGGWRLAPTELTYAGSRSRLSGLLGNSRTEIDATLSRMPLAAIDIGFPQLGLAGSVSGTLSYRSENGGVPTGNAQLQVIGLSRARATANSLPVDVALNAALTERAAALRAIIRAEGEVIGRIQGQVTPLAGTGLVDRVINAPLFAQLRFNGTSDTLWRLTGIDTIALSGPISIAADATGTIADPRIRGSLRTSGARLENAQTGTVVTGVSAIGRFDGSRLQLRNITGSTAGGGSVSGSADLDLASARGFGMDIRIQAQNALLIDRDDVTARVTGPIRIYSDGNGGEISGALALDSGSFRLGQAAAAEALPVINVVELNAPADRPDIRTAASPWRLNLTARGRNRFIVTGLGLESEWSTDVALRGSVTDFAISGAAELVRGDYIFAGRRFELESGNIRFTGSVPVDPVLDIVAVDDVAGIDAQIRVRGTGQRPEITFTSNPALPEDELLSRILFGSSITDISVAEAAQLGVALASLRDGDGGLDPINAIRRSIGLDRLRILPANSEIGAGTSVAAGINVTRRVYVEVITDGQGYNATRVEYRITRWLALLGAISTLGQQSVNVRVQRNY